MEVAGFRLMRHGGRNKTKTMHLCTSKGRGYISARAHFMANLFYENPHFRFAHFMVDAIYEKRYLWLAH